MPPVFAFLPPPVSTFNLLPPYYPIIGTPVKKPKGFLLYPERQASEERSYWPMLKGQPRAPPSKGQVKNGRIETVPKDVSSLLTLRKGNDEIICNYNKRYWELYNEIEECSEELAESHPKLKKVVSYKLGLTPCEKLWDDLMLNPSTDLQDLMTRMEMYARLEDDVRQAKRASGMSFWGEGAFKRWKENTEECEGRVRQ
ncbi:hypothetical protein Acr_28g0000110 [Actinidia rufa]|uniref:Uncharacterized protein n=1 Tax=Actinidia rufa TaxID=165716 RepID=A0A7J0H8A0_9ERIC|nr:hypothetical protein Acr_28g0000110 [Actinidia rufa]